MFTDVLKRIMSMCMSKQDEYVYCDIVLKFTEIYSTVDSGIRVRYCKQDGIQGVQYCFMYCKQDTVVNLLKFTVLYSGLEYAMHMLIELPNSKSFLIIFVKMRKGWPIEFFLFFSISITWSILVGPHELELRQCVN